MISGLDFVSAYGPQQFLETISQKTDGKPHNMYCEIQYSSPVIMGNIVYTALIIWRVKP